MQEKKINTSDMRMNFHKIYYEKIAPMMEKYEKEKKLVLFKGQNLGVTASFMCLLQHIPLYFNYIALCDQDDVWHRDKIERAVTVLSKCDQSIPQLYCSEYIFCDRERGRPVVDARQHVTVDIYHLFFLPRTGCEGAAAPGDSSSWALE